MLDVLGLVKTAADLLPRGWASWLAHRDPVRAQAARVLRAFEAHGIARTQIVRLLPPALPLPLTAFANPQSLREHLTPAFLDWVAGFFLLERGWLDGVADASPHSPYAHDFYKQPDELQRWLQALTAAHPLDFALYVLKTEPGLPNAASRGPFALVLREFVPGLDDGAIARYRLLSHGTHFEHVPCCIDLLASCAVADALSIKLRGLVVSRRQLQRQEDGEALIPEAMRKPRDAWQPDRLLYGPQDASPWFRGIRQEASEWLRSAGLEAAHASLDGRASTMPRLSPGAAGPNFEAIDASGTSARRPGF